MRVSRYADLIPLGAFILVIGIVFLFDRERASHPEREIAATQAAAERQASALADEVGNQVSALLGGVTTAKVAFGNVTDGASEAAFVATLDSLAARSNGLTGLSLVDPETERVQRVPGTGLGQRIMLSDTVVRLAYLRALGTKHPAATPVINYGIGQRVFVFDPVVPPDSSTTLAVLAAELDPQIIYRNAGQAVLVDTLAAGAMLHMLYGPDDVRLTTVQMVPDDWQHVSHDVRVADTIWRVDVAYPLPDLRAYRAERVATWIAGLALALAFALILHFLRRTIATQRDEIARRQVAEEAARTAAEEARDRAIQSRDLAAQLEAAQRSSQRLSTSLDPDDVVEQFLGAVAEILDADVASLYTFEEEGEVLVGRRRMVFRDIDGVTDRLRQEDIGQVRAPVALLPTLAEAVSTGDPYVVDSDGHGDSPLSGRSGSDYVASVTVPLMIAGHTVGVATWEVYSRPRRFPTSLVAFAQALGAPAAAALHTAELFASLEAERLRAAREALRFGAVLDQMADGVIVVDSAGNLERSNAAAAELLGPDLADVPLSEWPAHFDLVSAEGRPLGPGDFPLTRALRGEHVRRATFIVRSDWGTERYLSGSASPISAQSGQPAGAAMVLRDVSDEHQYAEMLRHTNRELRRQAEVLEQVNQQLREATKAKDQFLAVMSHELRTPINAIMGYSDLLDLGVKGPLNDDQRAMLARVRDTSRHLLGLINEVLDLAKIGAGRMDLALVELDVGVLVERAAQQVLPLAASKGLTLTVDIPPDHEGTPFLVIADETRLMQILVNLLSNAAKFTADGGIAVSCDERDDDVIIRVSDTGAGIPTEQLEQIFEEFYQVEGGLSRSTGGTGLGLAIARRFARLMGGDVTVSSEVGRGSTFTVRLPSAGSSVLQEGIGDEAAVVMLAAPDLVGRLALDLDGTARVVGVTEPAQLAGLVRRERPGLIAVDAHAPDLAAWRAITTLQSEAGMPTPPVLLFAPDDSTAERALDLGELTFLGKPISVEEATATVRRLVGEEPDPRVLVGDDDAHVRRILGEALAATDCDVRTASSGGELLDLARRVQPHIVLVDLLMPGMDGLEAIAVMRTEPNLSQVRIVALMNRELSTEEMAELEAAVTSVERSRRGRVRATADLVRRAIPAPDEGRRGSGALT
ncbi:MAG TPA: ATP-binding protein [Longimicrobiales bacterium]|nr:ATP-binding protein [Longimicrobiales bacterium]